MYELLNLDLFITPSTQLVASYLLQFFIRLSFSWARLCIVIHDVMRALRPRMRVVRPHTRRPFIVHAVVVTSVIVGSIECTIDGLSRVFLVDGHADDSDTNVHTHQVEDDGGEEADETESTARRREQWRWRCNTQRLYMYVYMFDILPELLSSNGRQTQMTQQTARWR